MPQKLCRRCFTLLLGAVLAFGAGMTLGTGSGQHPLAAMAVVDTHAHWSETG